jgi:hypothetical protein
MSGMVEAGNSSFERPSVKKSLIGASLVAALVFSPVATASATVSSLTDCAFGPAQVFDVQWGISGGNLEISSTTRPYGNVPNGQLSSSDWQDGYFVKFVESTSDPGTLAMERFNAAGVSQGFLNTTGTFHAYGEDFIFYLGGGSWGTVITTGEGFAYGASASLPVIEESPSIEVMRGYTNCSASPLGVGEIRDETNGGGGETVAATLALNLKVRVGQLLAGKEVEYDGEGLMPESEYVLELHSVVIELGSGITDLDGSFTDMITLPEGIEPGPHEIVLRGIDPEGEPIERIAYIYVGEDGTLLAKSYRKAITEADLLAMTGPVGYDPYVLGAAAGLALVSGLSLVAIRRRAFR